MSNDSGGEQNIGMNTFNASDWEKTMLSGNAEAIHSLPDEGQIKPIKDGALEMYNNGVTYSSLFSLDSKRSPQLSATLDMLGNVDAAFNFATNGDTFDEKDFIILLAHTTLDTIVRMEKNPRKKEYLKVFLEESEPVLTPLKAAYNTLSNGRAWDETLEHFRANTSSNSDD